MAKVRGSGGVKNENTTVRTEEDRKLIEKLSETVTPTDFSNSTPGNTNDSLDRIKNEQPALAAVLKKELQAIGH
jgi:hypothetical protein